MKLLIRLCALSLFPIVGLAQQAAPDKQETTQTKLNELIWKVQDEIESDPMLRGVMLTGAKFVPNPNAAGEELQLQGKLMDPAQSPAIKQLVLKALGNDPYWREGKGPLDVKPETMLPSLGSLSLANSYHAQALEHFWKGEYPEADRAFARALAESPNDDVLRYWRVVTALALNQEDRAKKKLAPLLQTYPLGSRTPIVATAFERLQGPRRKQLMSMENELLASM
jgi:tetratricopeptide (TPR) repeat protein